MKKFYSLIIFIIINFFLFNIVQAAFFENNSNFLFLEKLFFKKQKYIVFLIFFLPSIYFYKVKKFLLFSIFLFFQIFTIIYWQSLILWLRDLAGDSLSEINTLNIYFVFSWIGSILDYLKPKLDYDSFLKFYFLGFLVYFLFKNIFKKQSYYLINFPIIISFFFIVFFIKFNIGHLTTNIVTQKDIKKNFINSEIKYSHQNKVNLILFIGESNSFLNSDNHIQQLLDNKKISQKGKFEYYKKIYSTHTHSTPSLLRLFSVPNSNKKDDFFMPIENQKRINIFSFLNQNIIKTYISSTGTSGYDNLHYQVFFDSFNNKSFLNETNYKFEKNFFLEKIKETFDKNKTNNLIVLHSSAGHAPYEKFIPKNIYYQNDLYTENNSIKLFGDKKNYLNDVINYEKALKYNFKNLKDVISIIDESTPTILIYLSDHGESVFTGSGHDSSRLAHEMLRIPFLIFYNNEFITKHKNISRLNKKFKDKINTSDILKEIIFSIYSLDTLKNEYITDDNHKYQKIIFQRNKKAIIELIDLNFNRIALPEKFKLKKEKDTMLHVLADTLNENQICYHGSNTIARIKRALQITSCLEFDLVVENDELFVYHPPSKNINFTFREFLEVSNKANSLWIDAKNINSADNCLTMHNRLKEFRKIKDLNLNQKKIFIEFPSNTLFDNPLLITCMENMKLDDIDISYYIPGEDIYSCYNNLFKNNEICKNLINIVSIIDEEKYFNNISFDYKFSKILDKFNFKPKNLKLNTWHISFEEVKDLDFKKYNLVIPYSSDHNRNTF
jgi:hypothetical protein